MSAFSAAALIVSGFAANLSPLTDNLKTPAVVAFSLAGLTTGYGVFQQSKLHPVGMAYPGFAGHSAIDLVGVDSPLTPASRCDHLNGCTDGGRR